ncbi:DMT family transporter [Candidatus Symbiopectobacterium sp. NZEC135]|uniref:DMT family transporter n=1 Tax=Candidatus Symbiopectobacterium sp. NZEC135 TaxID=2820471 RepID=UPI00222790EB|nr:DMT family transporter [Candidatus Symbiopectobacterium sp. NZEC135]
MRCRIIHTLLIKRKRFSGDFLTGLAYLVIFPSWLSYVFWNRGIGDIGATRGEIYTHLIPLSGGVFSLVFLNTTLETFHLVSALLIVFGIWLCSKTPQQA